MQAHAGQPTATPSPSKAGQCHDVVVAYFTVVIAQSGASWKARDVEVDEAQSLDDLTDVLRSVGIADQAVLAVVEHEDEWFALIRVDGEDEPKLFVSDLGAAQHSHFGVLLASAADVEVDPDEEPAAPASDDDAEPTVIEPVVAVWAGEPDLLEDLGVSGRVLRKLVEENAHDPGAVLAYVGETAGFADLLEALR
jgi:putative tRNA adenosine deaminase-associated protein